MIGFPEGFVKECTFDLLGGTPPQVELQPWNDNTVHCTLTFTLEQEIRQDDWQMSLTPAFQPDFHWAPHLTPTDRHIMDQHSFRSPALIVHDGCRAMMLIPDLEIMSGGTPARWYMDLDAGRNRLTLGMSQYKVAGHVLFERSPGAFYPPGTVKIGFYLMMFEDGQIAANPWRPVLDFLWTKWGSRQFQDGAPQVGPMERYVTHTYNWAFHHWKDTVWQEFELGGTRVGAPVFIADVSQSPNYPGMANERESRSIWNQVWFSSLRSAQGLYRYGLGRGDAGLVRKALLTKELALAAPLRQGIFPTVIATPLEEVTLEDGQMVRRSKSWDSCFWGNSNRNPLFPWGPIGEAPYHVLDMSWTALLMLRWHEELEPDLRLREYASSYADALLLLQDKEGYFPAWLDKETLQPLEFLAQSPETSLSVSFLFKMHEWSGNTKYLSAALKALKSVMADIVPVGRWEDFETYWSCSSYGADHLIGRKVARNNMFKQCNFSIFWTAEALLHGYKITGDAELLTVGQRCLDELLMTQASWQPPYIHVEALGGFGVMNCDGEWNDARQSLFAELILQYGLELDKTEYIERGLAALRASFVMMYCPENTRTKQQWEKAHPFFNEKDYGFMMENYGHGGEADAEGLGMGTFTIYDWGNGAASEAYLRIKQHLGPVLKERYNYEI